MSKILGATLCAVSLIFALAGEAAARDGNPCAGQSLDNATWLSVAHPGLGELYLKGWGPFFERAPQKKFWLGLIPGFGWPGYLQVKSIHDVRKCRTDDDLWSWDSAGTSTSAAPSDGASTAHQRPPAKPGQHSAK